MNQSQIEQEMADLGVSRYRSNLAKARELGTETITPGGRRLLQEAFGALEAGLKAWITTAKGQQGATPPYLKHVETVGVAKTALIASKAILDSISRKSTLTTTAFFLAGQLEDEARRQRMWNENRDAYSQSERWYRGNGKKWRRRRQLRDERLYWRDEPWVSWPKREKLRLGVMLCELMRSETGLIDIYLESLAGVGKRKRVISMVGATEKCLAWLEDAHAHHESLHPTYLPCVIPPAPWSKPWGGGYYTNALIRKPLIKTTDKGYLADLEMADLEDVYAAVNALQNTAWEINTEVLQVMRHFWGLGVPTAGLPTREEDPVPERPEDYETNKASRGAYQAAVAQIRRRNNSNRSVRLNVARILHLAEKFVQPEGAQRIWFPYKADFRGRLYPIPAFLQPQGQSMARGLLRFADELPVDSVWATRWYAIHGANCFGVDKVSFHDRIEWVRQHASQISEVYNDPIANRWWTEADKPWEFLAWCLEYGYVLEEGWSNFKSQLPIAMDGSNNGLQIFSMLLRDPVGAKSTNVLSSASPQDIYQDVADAVTERLHRDAAEDHRFARHWIDHCPDGIPRAATKRSVMVLPYGGTAFSGTTFIRDWLLEEIGEITNAPWPQEYGWQPTRYLSMLIRASILEVVQAAQGCMDWLQEIARIAAQEDIHVQWCSPTGFLVRQDYRAYKTNQVKTRVGDSVRRCSIREDGNRINAERSINSISPNFVHSLDAAVLALSVNAAKDEGIDAFAMVHDSYAVHAQHAPTMARILREQYAQMFSQDLLEDFREQVQQLMPEGIDLPPVPSKGDLDVNEVTNSLYFFA